MRRGLLLTIGLAAAFAVQGQDPPALAAVREYALNYTRSLPNYTCVQETKRVSSGENTRNVHTDTFEEELSFVDGLEHYKVLKVNGAAPKNITHQQLGGSISEGEFGGLLKQIFDPGSVTAFRPQGSAKIQGREMMVLPFRVPQQTGYMLADGDLHRSLRIAFEGSVWADPQSNAVMKIAIKLVNIPKESRLASTDITLEYKQVDLSGQEFILPSQFTWSWRKRADFGFREENGINQIAFTGCRKFTAESSIDFGK